MCSTLILGDGADRLLAWNYDYALAHGLVATNPRGSEKENARLPGEPRLSWTVQYGNVTLNSFSLELPAAGMNEAGLAIALMWHDEGYAGIDASVPRLSALQWIQYQLDCHGTAREVVDSLSTTRPKHEGTPLHYTVLDAEGDCALIEFIGGEPHVTRRPAFAALTNSTYATSLTAAQSGEADDASHLSSLGRFATLHRLYGGSAGQRADVDVGFAALGAVAQGGSESFPWDSGGRATTTVWSVVFAPRERAIYLETCANRERRALRLDAVDLSPAAPFRVADIHEGDGDVGSLLEPYQIEDNRRLVELSGVAVRLSDEQREGLLTVVDALIRTRQMRF